MHLNITYYYSLTRCWRPYCICNGKKNKCSDV